MKHGNLSPLPAETVKFAKSIYNLNNIYLRIGDNADSLFRGIPVTAIDTSGATFTPPLVLLALTTIFQYVEQISDQRAIEALIARPDWKYALHLPLSFSGFDPKMLCSFRQTLNYSSDGQTILQKMIYRLAEFGLFSLSEGKELNANQLLYTVCLIDRVERVVEAVKVSLETLAVYHPDWLNSIARPHWYERYRNFSDYPSLPCSQKELIHLAQCTGEDILYLLVELQKVKDFNLDSLTEIQTLRRVWQEQYDQFENHCPPSCLVQWRTYGCGRPSNIRHCFI